MRRIVAALIAAGLVGAACNSSAPAQPASKAPEAPAASAAAKTPEAPAKTAAPTLRPGYQAFKKAGFSLALPESWGEINPTTKDLTGASSNASPELKRALASVNLDNSIKFYAIDTRGKTLDRAFATNVNILIEDLPTEMPASTYGKLAKGQLEQAGVTGIESGVMTYPAGEAAVFAYALPAQVSGETKLTPFIMQAAFVKGKTAYIVTLATLIEASSDYENVMDDLVRSFRIEQ